MRLIGFNFKKINAEKIVDSSFNELKINTNIELLKIEEVNSEMIKKEEKIIKLVFRYKILYEPNLAIIELEGNIFVATDTEKGEDILKRWKSKELPEDFKIALFNLILKKSNVKAFQLEDELTIPLHISLPTLKRTEEKTEKKEEDRKKDKDKKK